MKLLLPALLLSSSLLASSREPPPVRYERMGVANGCFVESVACFDAFRETAGGEAWARVLQWGAEENEVMVAGHAVAVLESSGRLWCFDINYGWNVLAVDPAQREAAEVVAAPVLVKYPKVSAFYPVLWDDSGQAPGPPIPDSAAPDEVARDAGAVATRLAAHRPVNLVGFSIPDNDGLRRSEAVVFVFGGRMCVYSPEKGTEIFRTRSSVWNVHLVQELLRRMFPGLQDIHPVAAPAR